MSVNDEVWHMALDMSGLGFVSGHKQPTCMRKLFGMKKWMWTKLGLDLANVSQPRTL